MGKRQKQYYSLFLERRLLYATSLVFLRDYRFIQAGANWFLSVQVTSMQEFFVVAALKPFEIPFVAFCHTVAELCVSLVFVCTGIFLFDQDTFSHEFLAYAGIGLSGTAIGIHVFVGIILFLKRVCELLQPRRPKPKPLDKIKRKGRIVL